MSLIFPAENYAAHMALDAEFQTESRMCLFCRRSVEKIQADGVDGCAQQLTCNDFIAHALVQYATVLLSWLRVPLQSRDQTVSKNNASTIQRERDFKVELRCINLLIRKMNADFRVQRCQPQCLKQVACGDESSFTMFLTGERLHVCLSQGDQARTEHLTLRIRWPSYSAAIIGAHS